MKFRPIKILAYGSYKRFMWLDLNDTTYCLKITEELYQKLKKEGVPTCQSLRQPKYKTLSEIMK